MMKTKAGLLFLALSITACSTDNEPINDVGTPVAARVTAGIGGVASRAVGNQWGNGDCIGISGTSGAKVYTNMQYRTSGDGAFAHVGGDATGIYLQANGTSTFTAYYPFTGNENMEAGIITDVSTEEQSNNEDFDFMFASGATASSSNPQLAFTGDAAFRHCMTRLVLNIKTEDGFDLSDVTKGTYSLRDIMHRGTFNTSTGEAVAIGDATDNWKITATAFDDANRRTYDMILYPQSDTEIKFDAVFYGTKYSCTLLSELKSGYSYTYDLTIKKTGVTISSCGITPWKTANHNGTATVIPPIGNKAMELVDLGDFYFSDGTFADKETTLSYEQKVACIGVVLKVGCDTEGQWADNNNYRLKDGISSMPEVHGYVLALYDANDGNNCAWGSSGTEVGCDRNQAIGFNGYSNTQMIIDLNKSNQTNQLKDAFPAVYHATIGYEYECSAPANTSGWFLPSSGQCKYWLDNKDVIIQSIIKAGGDEWKDTYWSSSERTESPNIYAYCLYMEYRDIYGIRKSRPGYVRAILAF